MWRVGDVIRRDERDGGLLANRCLFIGDSVLTTARGPSVFYAKESEALELRYSYGLL